MLTKLRKSLLKRESTLKLPDIENNEAYRIKINEQFSELQNQEKKKKQKQVFVMADAISSSEEEPELHATGEFEAI